MRTIKYINHADPARYFPFLEVGQKERSQCWRIGRFTPGIAQTARLNVNVNEYLSQALANI